MYTAINFEQGNCELASFEQGNFAVNADSFTEEPMVLSAKRCADGNGTLSYLFFSEEWVDVQRAKAICARCSDKDQCLQGALEREEPWGVWGGEELDMGRVAVVRRPRGRPPVNGRAVTSIPEVPIPAHLVA